MDQYKVGKPNGRQLREVVESFTVIHLYSYLQTSPKTSGVQFLEQSKYKSVATLTLILCVAASVSWKMAANNGLQLDLMSGIMETVLFALLSFGVPCTTLFFSSKRLRIALLWYYFNILLLSFVPYFLIAYLAHNNPFSLLVLSLIMIRSVVISSLALGVSYLALVKFGKEQ